MMPDVKPDRSEVSSFDSSKLKHVETAEKSVLPTKEGVLCLSHKMILLSMINVARAIRHDCMILDTAFVIFSKIT